MVFKFCYFLYINTFVASINIVLIVNTVALSQIDPHTYATLVDVFSVNCPL